MALFDKTITIAEGDRETKDPQHLSDVSILDTKRGEIAEAIKSYYEILRIWGRDSNKYRLEVTFKLKKVK